MKKLFLSLLVVLISITSFSQTRSSAISAPLVESLANDTHVLTVEENKAKYVLWSTMRGNILNDVITATVQTLDVSAEWTTGLSFDVTARNFPVSEVWYSATNGVVTLDVADSTYDRIDLIVANKNGTVGKVTGDPSAAPAEPDYDASEVYPIKFVMVKAGEIIPTNPNTGTPFATQLVYNENIGPPTEWTTTVTSNLNKTSTTAFYSGTMSIEATTTTLSDKSTFIATAPLSVSELSSLTFWIKLKAPLGSSYIFIKFWDNNTQLGRSYLFNHGKNGLDGTSLNWQKIVLDKGLFNLPTGSTYNKIQIYPFKSGYTGYFLDLVSISDGSLIVSPPTDPNTSEITKTSQLTNDGEDGVNPFIVAGEVPLYTLSAIDGSNNFSLLKNGVAVNTLDLTPYLDDTNTYLASGALNPTTGILTGTRNDASTFTIDLSDLIDVQPTTTSQLTNNGSDGVNPYISSLDIPTTTSSFTNDGDDGINPFISVNDVVQTTQELLDVSVEWISGLTFNVVADRFPVGNQWYSSTAANVTLDVADITYDRIDLLVGNTNGTVGKVTGVASANPAPPDYDLDTQYPIRFVLVKTGDTTPIGYSNTDGLVFDENVGEPTEWTYLPGTAAVAITATSPDTGTVSVEATSPGYEGVKLFNDAYISNLDLSLITFRFKLKAVFLGSSAIEIRVYDYKAGISSTFKWKFSVRNGDHGFDGNNITTYQTIRLDAGDVNLPTFDFNMIEITAAKNGHPGWFVDNVKLQYNTSGVTIVNNNGSSVTNTSQLINDGENGINPFITLNEVPPQINSDWTSSSGVSQILNKPTITNPTGLEAINEGNGIGWRMIGQDPSLRSNIGVGSVDLTTLDPWDTDLDYGPFAEYSFMAGEANKITGPGYSAIIGHGNSISSTYTSNYIFGVFNSITAGYGNVLIGYYNQAATDPNGYAVLLGNNNRAFGTAPSGAIGTALDVRGRGQVAVGIANTIWLGTNMDVNRPMFTVGIGTSTTPVGPWEASVRKDGFIVDASGVVTAPDLSTAEITAESTGKVLITKEYANANYSSSSVGVLGVTGTSVDNTDPRNPVINMPSGTPTGLEAIDEGNGIGWRLIGRNPALYGNIGLEAIDFSYGGSSISGATGNFSFATGYITEATGGFSFATGYGTEAIGEQSFVSGSFTAASGNNSSAFGWNTTASSQSEMVIGMYNTPSTGSVFDYIATDRIFVIGNGMDINTRSNAMVVLKNGTITAPTLTTALITAESTGKVLITKEYANETYAKVGTVAPASATDTGTTGEIRVTATYIYTCIATNTWVRAALATW